MVVHPAECHMMVELGILEMNLILSPPFLVLSMAFLDTMLVWVFDRFWGAGVSEACLEG